MEPKKVIPILIHHETGEKPQTGGGANQEYLKYCILQAKKFNEKVVLFGDEYNKKWCDDWHSINEYDSEKWHHFERVFENLVYSSYTDAWALGIFKRFFIFEEYLKHNGYKECVMMDSDVLIFLNLSEYPQFANCQAAYEIPNTQNLECVDATNDLRMCAIPGVAYFTLEALSEFTSFCIDVYENRRDLIMPKYEAHMKYHIGGGVCEMSILYLFAKLMPKGYVINLLEEYDGRVFTGNTVGTDDLTYDQYELSALTQMKKISFKGEQAYMTLKGGRKIPVNNIHFGGADKIFIKSLYLYHHVTIGPLASRWYWKLRGKLRFLKRIFKRK